MFSGSTVLDVKNKYETCLIITGSDRAASNRIPTITTVSHNHVSAVKSYVADVLSRALGELSSVRLWRFMMCVWNTPGWLGRTARMRPDGQWLARRTNTLRKTAYCRHQTCMFTVICETMKMTLHQCSTVAPKISKYYDACAFQLGCVGFADTTAASWFLLAVLCHFEKYLLHFTKKRSSY